MKLKLFLLFTFLSFSLMGCGNYISINEEQVSTQKDLPTKANNDFIEVENIEVEKKEEIEPEIVEPDKVSLVAVGDNLIHSMLIKSGLKNGFDYMYEDISEYIKDFDIKAINQETILINNPEKYSGYPTFGSPIAVGQAAIDAGFNLITQATNHSYDKKEEGIIDSINFWKSNKDITMVGIHDSQEDAEKIATKTINNISFSFLNYTYGLNGFKLPEDKKYLVDTFMDLDEKNYMLDSIAEASNLSDFTIVFIHWGNEYQIKENEVQRNLALEIANAGADLIIGTHPHVVEPLKYIKTDDNRNVPVYYSLGNFISNQDKLDTMLGGLAEINFVKDNGDCYIEDCKLLPLCTQIKEGQTFFKTTLLENLTEEDLSNHKLHNKGLSKKYLLDRFEEILKEETEISVSSFL